MFFGINSQRLSPQTHQANPPKYRHLPKRSPRRVYWSIGPQNERNSKQESRSRLANHLRHFARQNTQWINAKLAFYFFVEVNSSLKHTRKCFSNKNVINYADIGDTCTDPNRTIIPGQHKRKLTYNLRKISHRILFDFPHWAFVRRIFDRFSWFPHVKPLNFCISHNETWCNVCIRIKSFCLSIAIFFSFFNSVGVHIAIVQMHNASEHIHSIAFKLNWKIYRATQSIRVK